MTISSEPESSQKEIADIDFLNEIKKQFDRYEDLRKGLDNKANTMITISGAISTLLIAIGTFLISKIEPRNDFFFGAILIFSLGIIFSTLAIYFFIQSYSLKKYRYALTHHEFFDEKGYKEIDIDTFRMSSKTHFIKYMIKQYLKSLKNFDEQNIRKAEEIRNGQTLLLSAVITVSMLLIYILVSLGMHFIKIL
jgi:hypothetical protein